LAAILAVDVAGYSRLMGEDEEGTLAVLRAVRRELGDATIAEHPGRIVKTTGDRLEVAFDDLGEQQVKNITRPVHAFAVCLGPRASGPHAGETPAFRPAPLPLPDKPSLAVLPFQNMTGDAEQEYFVDGMVEEITTAIARMPWLFVIARNSITGQLIDATTGAHIWADRFDGKAFSRWDKPAPGVRVPEGSSTIRAELAVVKAAPVVKRRCRSTSRRGSRTASASGSPGRARSGCAAPRPAISSFLSR
jgi:hypothetical protein